MNKETTDVLRNVRIPVAVARPETYKKLAFVSFIVLYLMMVLSYFTNGFLTSYIYLEIVIITLALLCVSKIYDKIYVDVYNSLVDMTETGIVVGFSNKLFLLQGANVIDVYDTDMIRIRNVNEEENETFFGKNTSILECLKDGEVIGRIGIDKLPEYEGAVLEPNMERVNEDIEIVFDDEDEGEDPDGFDGEYDDEDMDDGDNSDF